MSFGSGFGGFGSNNNQSSGFGGFGSNNQSSTTGGFGSTGAGFGSTTNQSGGGLFGNTSGGFGSGGGFGSSSGSAFGQNKTGFGSTTTTSGGGLFGSGTATSGGFGGFGGSSTQAFGGGTNTSGGLFGQSKPTFGGTSGGGLFGSGGSGAFGGSSTTTPGFGGGISAVPQNNGTGSIPFQPFEEKDQGTTTKNQYQTITIQDPYKAFSLEELRLVDYAQGRKHGNASNQPGAFGATTGFGGFGQSSTGTPGFGTSSTGGGLFGQSSTSSPFGQQTGTSGFGGGSATGLFGSKPQTTTLFGSTTTTTAPSTGGLFGSSGGGFGSGTSGGGFGSGTSGANLFGQQNQQNKPTFGGFGSGTTGGGFASSTGGFGSGTTSSGGGLFGNGTATASPFGQQQGTGTSFGGFGQQNTQQQGQTGGGIFGSFGSSNQNQQQKPGLFGSTSTTGTGLFGGQQNQQSSGSNLFGGTSTSNLFGNKTATSNPFGSLGSSTGGSSIFGNNQQQQQSGSGGIFGQSNQQSTSNIFGGNKPTLSTGLFGQNNNQQQSTGGGLFSGSQQQQTQPQSSFGSMFGSSQVQPQQQQQPQQLNASQIQFPYGAPSLFLDVQSPAQSPGPIATPLSTSQKAKKQAIIPAYRINPSASSRLITPQKRPQGYGFSYSTYGTPGSAFGSSPVGMGNSLLGSSIGRSLGKSYSSSNLRNSYTTQDSLLIPGAFSGSTRSGTGSMKKLNINRNLNTRRSLFEGDLSDDFAGQNGLRKQVSFDSGTKHINGAFPKENGLNAVNGALVRTDNADRHAPVGSDSRLDGRPEMEQVNGTTGKELAVISEDGSPPAASTKTSMSDAEKARLTQKDQQPGDYWMKPTLSELQKMSKSQLAHVKDFRVGRIGVGEIQFGNVDLTKVPLDKIIGDIVVLDVRRATVYGDDTTVPKPNVGIGLNVPSTITLENSWPRASAGRLPVFEKHGERFNKHIKRLKRVENTTFVDYDEKKGRWTFKVEHYTTYGLDYDDDEESMLSSSVLSEAAPPTPTPLKATPRAAANNSQQKSPEDSIMSPPESSPDDTFDFKKGRRKNVPGQFDEQEADLLEDESMAEAEHSANTPQSFLEERSVGSSAGEDDDQAMAVISQTEGFAPEVEMDMAGAFPIRASTAEQDESAFNASTRSPSKLKSILKVRDADETPFKAARLDVDDWAEQLQRTVSPMKRDRQALRDIQATLLTDHDQPASVPTGSVHGAGFATSIDLMNSIFGKPTAKRTSNNVNGMELRSGKRLRANEQSEDAEIAFHQSVKPRFGANGVLVYVAPGSARMMQDGVLINLKGSIIAEHQDVRFARFATPEDLIPPTIAIQQETTELDFGDYQIPYATTVTTFKFAELSEALPPTSTAHIYERQVWDLAGVLFDDAITSDQNTREQERHERERLPRLKELWIQLCKKDAEKQLASVTTAEEKAFIHLASGDIINACAALLEGGNVHLATLVAQLPGDQGFRLLMKEQLESWRALNTLSEFNDAIRAIYEVLAGNVCMSEGFLSTTAENRITELRFSQQFGLTWRQAFALHLFYGIEHESGIQDAVRSYQQSLQEGKEMGRPLPWFMEQHISTGWNDPHAEEREDPLWGLLKLYVAFTEDGQFASISDITKPENVSGNPIEARLSFQLFYLLRAHSGMVETADHLTRTYAASLEQVAGRNYEALKTGIWVLAHLSDESERALNIKRFLNIFAAQLSPTEQPLALSAPPGSGLRLLVTKEWECAAKALYARAVEQDPISEARWLINAGDLAEAHNVICKVIGPNAIIEHDYDQLREVLGSLNDDRRRKRQVSSSDWERGGGLYHAFIELFDFETMPSQHRTKKRSDLETTVQHIAAILAGIKKEGGLKVMDFRQRVAMQMMAQHVLEVHDKEKVEFFAGRRVRTVNRDFADTLDQATDKLMALRLPLTQDMQLNVSRQLAMEYYKLSVMSGM